MLSRPTFLHFFFLSFFFHYQLEQGRKTLVKYYSAIFFIDAYVAPQIEKALSHFSAA
jgi:hypothetical protein